MHPNDAGQGLMIGECQRAVSQLHRALGQFLGMRSAAQERKVASAAQLRIGVHPPPSPGRLADITARGALQLLARMGMLRLFGLRRHGR